MKKEEAQTDLTRRDSASGSSTGSAPSFSIEDVSDCLQYIIDSPTREHGGFHPQTIETARSALYHIKQLRFELLMVSKLAADIPMFYNPINVAHAKAIRDRVLSNAKEYL